MRQDAFSMRAQTSRFYLQYLTQWLERSFHQIYIYPVNANDCAKRTRPLYFSPEMSTPLALMNLTSLLSDRVFFFSFIWPFCHFWPLTKCSLFFLSLYSLFQQYQPLSSLQLLSPNRDLPSNTFSSL